jgi:hypothetical protein
MIETTTIRRRGALRSGLAWSIAGLFFACGAWATAEEAAIARARQTGASAQAGRQASATRPSSAPTVAPQQSTAPSTSSSSPQPRQPTARDTRENPPGQWKPPGSSGGSGGGGGHHPSWGGYWGYRYPWYWNDYCWGSPSCWGWGWGYWGPYWYYPPAAYPVVYSLPSTVRVAADKLGALHFRVKPKKAQVWVDGRFVGLAKQFDGYPGFLWLEEGSYEISLVREGYATFTDRVAVRSGYVTDLPLRLEKGLSTPPERPPAGTAESEPQAREQGAVGEVVSSEPAISQDVRATPGQLELAVQPADASVYLDGRLLGSGEELVSLHAPLIVDSGAHALEVVRPGYQPQRLEFEVDSGQTVSLRVTLLP